MTCVPKRSLSMRRSAEETSPGQKLHIISICPRLLCRRSKVSGCLRCGRLRSVMRICRCGDTGARTHSLERAVRVDSRRQQRVSERCVRASHSPSHLCNAAYRRRRAEYHFQNQLIPDVRATRGWITSPHPKENEVTSGVMNLRRVSVTERFISSSKIKTKRPGIDFSASI